MEKWLSVVDKCCGRSVVPRGVVKKFCERSVVVRCCREML